MNLNYLMFGKDQMEQLIPQRNPMVMVDGLLNSDEQSTTSTLTILEENMFVQQDFLQESGIIENMAQTAALRAGYQAKLKGSTPDIGFIGAVKRLTIQRLPQTNEQLLTEITLTSEMLGAMIVHATTRINNEVIAEGDLSIFLSQPTKTN